MSSTAHHFDLAYIFTTIRRHIKFVLIVTVLAIVLALIAYLVKGGKYMATAEFFVANPLYTDRNSVFKSSDGSALPISYFAEDVDIDKVIGITKSEQYKRNVVKAANLDKYYDINPAKPADEQMLADIFSDNLKVKRSEYQIMQLSFTANDPENAARIANVALVEVEKIYRGFHNGLRENVIKSLTEKLAANDSAIAALTDTLTRLRDEFGIYDLISPTRYNLINQSGLRSAASGRGVELIQNVEAMKDQQVVDRARQQSILEDYIATSKADDASLFNVISPAIPPAKKAGLQLRYILIGAGFTGAFLAILWVLFVSFLRSLPKE